MRAIGLRATATAGTTAVALALAVVACANTNDLTSSAEASRTATHLDSTEPNTPIASAPAAPLSTPVTQPTPADFADPGSLEAIAALATIPVKGRAPKTGYDRGLFGAAWTDDVAVLNGHNGCDTRNDILRRDLVDIVIKPGSNGCAVLSGMLHDPYTGSAVNFQRGQDTSARVQIDHLVALSDAWQKGAQGWDEAKRRNFANDPINLQATIGSINQKKRDSDAATWLPPNTSYRCSYASRIVAVKATYGLWVTQAEHDALGVLLAECAAAPPPSETLGPPRPNLSSEMPEPSPTDLLPRP